MVVGEKSCFSFFCFFSIGLLFVFLDPQKGKNSWASQLNAELPLSAWWGQSSRLRDSGVSTSIWHSELWFSTEYPQIDLRKSSLELHFQTYLHFVYQRLPRPSRWRVLSFTFLWVEATYMVHYDFELLSFISYTEVRELDSCRIIQNENGNATKHCVLLVSKITANVCLLDWFTL